MLTNTQGTNVHEIADGIFRINTPIAIPGGPDFNFNQYLVVDDEPLLFHSGPRGLFPLVREAIDRVMPVARLRYVGFSHFEADECGALNAFLAVAPEASPLCSRIAALVSVNDIADRPARALADGETLSLGRRVLRWFDTPHLPHGWDCGLMMDTTTRTFFCGDLYTQGGPGTTPLTSSDILGPSEAFRKQMDYYSHAPDTKERVLRLAKEKPATLACMHGSAWRGDGEQLLRALAEAVG
jgi:flavorubredoxin